MTTLEDFHDFIGWAKDDNDFKKIIQQSTKIDKKCVIYDLTKQAERWRQSIIDEDKNLLIIKTKYITKMIDGIKPLIGIYSTDTHLYYFSQYLNGVFVYKKNYLMN